MGQCKAKQCMVEVCRVGQREIENTTRQVDHHGPRPKMHTQAPEASQRQAMATLSNCSTVHCSLDGFQVPNNELASTSSAAFVSNAVRGAFASASLFGTCMECHVWFLVGIHHRLVDFGTPVFVSSLQELDHVLVGENIHDDRFAPAPIRILAFLRGPHDVVNLKLNGNIRYHRAVLSTCLWLWRHCRHLASIIGCRLLRLLSDRNTLLRGLIGSLDDGMCAKYIRVSIQQTTNHSERVSMNCV